MNPCLFFLLLTCLFPRWKRATDLVLLEFQNTSIIFKIIYIFVSFLCSNSCFLMSLISCFLLTGWVLPFAGREDLQDPEGIGREEEDPTAEARCEHWTCWHGTAPYWAASKWVNLLGAGEEVKRFSVCSKCSAHAWWTHGSLTSFFSSPIFTDGPLTDPVMVRPAGPNQMNRTQGPGKTSVVAGSSFYGGIEAYTDLFFFFFIHLFIFYLFFLFMFYQMLTWSRMGWV